MSARLLGGSSPETLHVENPKHYLACGELKGGIDPAGADEHWKTAGKALSAGQIAEISGLDRKEVDKVMKTLKTEGKIVSPKVCYWQPA